MAATRAPDCLDTSPRRERPPRRPPTLRHAGVDPRAPAAAEAAKAAAKQRAGPCPAPCRQRYSLRSLHLFCLSVCRRHAGAVMGLPSRGRRGCTSPATVFSAIVLLALTTWATLLYRVFALPTAHPPSAGASCFSEERLMWSQRVVLPDRTLPAAIHVSADGKIKAVHQHQPRLEAEILAKRLGVRFEPWDTEAISPGVVDAYAHLGAVLEGTGRSWEGFASGTQAAAAGGVTTVIDLPAHSHPQTTTAAILRRKAAAARGKLHADVGFWGALVPENAEDSDTLLELLAQGALGLSAVVAMGMQPDTQVGSQRALGLSELETAVGTVAPANRPVLVHAEMVPPSEEHELRQRRASPQDPRLGFWF